MCESGGRSGMLAKSEVSDVLGGWGKGGRDSGSAMCGRNGGVILKRCYNWKPYRKLRIVCILRFRKKRVAELF